MQYVFLFAGTGPASKSSWSAAKEAAADAQQYERAALPHNPGSASRAESPVNSGYRAERRVFACRSAGQGVDRCPEGVRLPGPVSRRWAGGGRIDRRAVVVPGRLDDRPCGTGPTRGGLAMVMA